MEELQFSEKIILTLERLLEGFKLKEGSIDTEEIQVISRLGLDICEGVYAKIIESSLDIENTGWIIGSFEWNNVLSWNLWRSVEEQRQKSWINEWDNNAMSEFGRIHPPWPIISKTDLEFTNHSSKFPQPYRKSRR